jgi:hypothetical protein
MPEVKALPRVSHRRGRRLDAGNAAIRISSIRNRRAIRSGEPDALQNLSPGSTLLGSWRLDDEIGEGVYLQTRQGRHHGGVFREEGRHHLLLTNGVHRACGVPSQMHATFLAPAKY